METWVVVSGCIIAALILVIILLVYTIYKKKKIIESIKIKSQEDIASVRETCDNEKKKLASDHSAEIDLIRQEYARQIQQVREEIENRKDVLSQMDEKELLARVMIALDGYGGRFDRIENQLTEQTIVSRVTIIVQELINKLSSMEESINKQIEETYNTIEQSVNDSSFVHRLGCICSDIGEIKNDVNSINWTINEIDSTADRIESTVDQIHSSVSDRYSYDSLASNIDSLHSVVEEAKNAAESAKYAIESHL